MHGRSLIRESQTAFRCLTTPLTSVLVFKRMLVASLLAAGNTPPPSSTYSPEPLPGSGEDGHVHLKAMTSPCSHAGRHFHPRRASPRQGRGAGRGLTSLLCPCLSRCPFSKVSASSRYLLPPLPPGPPAAAAAGTRLPPGPPRAVAAGPQRPHGPGPPAQRHPAPVTDSAAHPAVPGRHRSLLPTSGPAPAIPPAAAAPGSPAPQARLAPEVGGAGARPRAGHLVPRAGGQSPRGIPGGRRLLHQLEAFVSDSEGHQDATRVPSVASVCPCHTTQVQGPTG